jgi:hypothetical protein
LFISLVAKVKNKIVNRQNNGRNLQKYSIFGYCLKHLGGKTTSFHDAKASKRRVQTKSSEKQTAIAKAAHAATTQISPSLASSQTWARGCVH